MNAARTLIKEALYLTIVITLSACGKGFEVAEKVSCAGSGCSDTQSAANDGNSDDSTRPGKKFEIDPILLSFKGIINGGPADQTLAFEIDPETKEMIIILPFAIPNLSLNAWSGSIQGLPGASGQVIDIENGGAILVRLPLEYLMSRPTFLTTAKLPNGDPLPGLASTELPHAIFKIPNNSLADLHFYIGEGQIGLFLTTPIDPYITMTFHIRDQSQTAVLGNFSLVPEKNSFLGGQFLSAGLPDDVAARIATLLE